MTLVIWDATILIITSLISTNEDPVAQHVSVSTGLNWLLVTISNDYFRVARAFPNINTILAGKYVTLHDYKKLSWWNWCSVQWYQRYMHLYSQHNCCLGCFLVTYYQCYEVMKCPHLTTNIDDIEMITKMEPFQAHACVLWPFIAKYHYGT